MEGFECHLAEKLVASIDSLPVEEFWVMCMVSECRKRI
jgi:hypothetical protein